MKHTQIEKNCYGKRNALEKLPTTYKQQILTDKKQQQKIVRNN